MGGSPHNWANKVVSHNCQIVDTNRQGGVSKRLQGLTKPAVHATAVLWGKGSGFSHSTNTHAHALLATPSPPLTSPTRASSRFLGVWNCSQCLSAAKLCSR